MLSRGRRGRCGLTNGPTAKAGTLVRVARSLSRVRPLVLLRPVRTRQWDSPHAISACNLRMHAGMKVTFTQDPRASRDDNDAVDDGNLQRLRGSPFDPCTRTVCVASTARLGSPHVAHSAWLTVRGSQLGSQRTAGLQVRAMGPSKRVTIERVTIAPCTLREGRWYAVCIGLSACTHSRTSGPRTQERTLLETLHEVPRILRMPQASSDVKPHLAA